MATYKHVADYVVAGQPVNDRRVAIPSDPATGQTINILTARHPDGTDEILGAVQSEEDARRFAQAQVARGYIGWFEHILQGLNGPHLTWPSPQSVFAVIASAAGPRTDTQHIDIYSVYSDATSAQACAAEFNSKDDCYEVVEIAMLTG